MAWGRPTIDMGPAGASQRTVSSDPGYQAILALFPEPASYLRTGDSIFFMSQISPEGRFSFQEEVEPAWKGAGLTGLDSHTQHIRGHWVPVSLATQSSWPEAY